MSAAESPTYTPGQMTEARGWIADCVEDPEQVAEFDDATVLAGVDRQYDGGWAQFVRDVEPEAER